MKTKLQRLQSRISKRRNFIRTINDEIEVLVVLKMLTDLPDHAKEAAKVVKAQYRESARVLGADQRLDKELFQMLLAQERDKYQIHFRSAYPRFGGVFQGDIFNG